MHTLNIHRTCQFLGGFVLFCFLPIANTFIRKYHCISTETDIQSDNNVSNLSSPEVPCPMRGIGNYPPETVSSTGSKCWRHSMPLELAFPGWNPSESGIPNHTPTEVWFQILRLENHFFFLHMQIFTHKRTCPEGEIEKAACTSFR